MNNDTENYIAIIPHHNSGLNMKTLAELIKGVEDAKIMDYLDGKFEQKGKENTQVYNDIDKNLITVDGALVLDESKNEVTGKQIPEFEAIILSIIGRDGYNVNNKIRIGSTTGTYMGDHGTVRKIEIFSLDSPNQYEITVFINVFMHEISESTMMQIMESNPLASRYAYHNNRLMEVVHIKNGIRYDIHEFESEELKDQNFEDTLIGLSNLLFGDTIFGANEVLEG